MKNLKKVLALVLAVVMIMSVVTVASAKTYKDVDSTNTYADAIDALSSLKILDGFKDGDSYSFKAEDPFTRAQAAKIVAIVHNAATNGKIKDQDAISALYSNAQNPFVDCNNSWALPFINYCRITGLADGMTTTTYEPNRYVTGVQFLKLMLTTLNFDTAKEGYTGTGWDVNVLNRANEVGLTAGLKDGWKAIAPITRGEAAQVLYNALTKYLVEYGQLVKNNYVNSVAADTNKKIEAKDGYYKSSFISNEQVAQSGYTLAAKMGITVTRMYDVFGRPGYMWKYKTWSKFYMDAPLASFTGTATECDILVGAGIPKTSTDTLKYDYFENGAWLQYHGHKSARTLSHADRHCENTTTNPVFGATGALTQVFAADDGKTYIITRIDTVLTKVTKVNDNSKHGNNGGESNVDIYNRNALQNNLIVLENKFNMSSKTGAAKYVVEGLYSYAKNSYVLAYMSSLIADAAAYKNTVYEGKFYLGDALVETSATTTASSDVYTVAYERGDKIPNLYFVPVKVAESKDQKLTGRALNDTSKITLDGEKVPTARGYILDEARVAHYVANTDDTRTDVALLGNTYKFFRDQYGNVIADIKSADEINYAVVDGIVWITNGASYSDGQYASAGIVKAGENAVTDVTVAKAGKAGTFVAASGVENREGWVADATVSTVKTNNYRYTDCDNFHGVVKYSVDADGKYTLNYNDASFYHLCNLQPNGLTVETKNPAIATTNNGTKLTADEETVFVVKTKVDGKYVYTSYTGISAVPTIKCITHAVAVKEANDSFVSFVYIDATNAVFAGSTTIAFVAGLGANYEEKDVVYTYDYVYINGVKTSIDVLKTVTGNPAQLFAQTGLYELNYDAAGKVCNVKKLTAADKLVENGTINAINGNILSTNVGELNLAEAKIYFVLNNGAGVFTDVVEKTAADLDKDMTFIYTYANNAAPYMVESLYVVSLPQD
ncbi:MAG: S-layer homology domain-containing protein [Clostridiales bacterium]|nr:S-layer homology domain-containing protein [Clostridiales bacterium]